MLSRMAQSFWQPGVECSVEAIQRQSSDAWTQWNLFCDCMYRAGSPEHARCRQKHCAVPWGCDRTWGTKDPFDVSVGLLAPPWTEVGAATRNIMHRAPTIVTTATQLTTIRPENWNPLILWQTYWTNPGKYAVWLGQAQVIGSLLAPATGGLSTIWAGYMAAAGPNPPFQLLPGALIEVAAQKKDVVQELVVPATVGSIKNLGMSLAYLGNCGIGVNVPCGAGLLVKRVAQDQIDDGTINGADPVTQAVIRFLADQGDNFISTAVKAVTSAPSKALARQVITIMRSGFVLVREAAAGAGDTRTRDVANTLVTVADVADIVAKGLEDRAPAIDIVDSVVYRLLGISIKTFKVQLQSDVAAARSTIEAAQKSRGFSLEQVGKLINDLGGVMNRIASFISEVESKAGTSLGDLSRMFASADAALGGTKAELAQVQAVAASKNVPVTAASVARSGGRSPTSTSPQGNKPMDTLSLLSTFIGGAAGALVAGPPGAVAGGAVGYAAGGLLRGGSSESTFTEPTLTVIGKVDPRSNVVKEMQARGVDVKNVLLAAQNVNQNVRGFGRYASGYASGYGSRYGSLAKGFTKEQVYGPATQDAALSTDRNVRGVTPGGISMGRGSFITATEALEAEARPVLRRLAESLLASGESMLTWSRVMDLAQRVGDSNARWLAERPSVFQRQPMTTSRTAGGGEPGINLRAMLSALDQQEAAAKAAQALAATRAQAEAEARAKAEAEAAEAARQAAFKTAMSRGAVGKAVEENQPYVAPYNRKMVENPPTVRETPPTTTETPPAVEVVQTPTGLAVIPKTGLSTGVKVGIGFGALVLLYAVTRKRGA
jgi:hypothetical protein